MADFVPCTVARSIGDGVYFRPIRSWHSGTYAGEGLFKIPGTTDGSGCLKPDRSTYPPHTVTHRLYWHERDPTKTISAFLSYPNGMGAVDQYFWESYGTTEDVERYLGDNAETEMESAIKGFFNDNRS